MKKISVQYFAALREQSGKDQETLVTDSQSAGDLYRSLLKNYGFTLEPDLLRCAINDQYKPMNHPLQDGDRVVFIPPVAGG